MTDVWTLCSEFQVKFDWIWLHTSLKWLGIQHNWLEIVYCPAVILSSVYVNLIVRFCTATCMNVSASRINISALSIAAFGAAWSLYIWAWCFQPFVHNISLKVSALCVTAQCICAFEHSKFFIPVTIIIAQFGNPQLCSLNPCKSRPSEGNDQEIKAN